MKAFLTALREVFTEWPVCVWFCSKYVAIKNFVFNWDPYILDHPRTRSGCRNKRHVTISIWCLVGRCRRCSHKHAHHFTWSRKKCYSSSLKSHEYNGTQLFHFARTCDARQTNFLQRTRTYPDINDMIFLRHFFPLSWMFEKVKRFYTTRCL